MRDPAPRIHTAARRSGSQHAGDAPAAVGLRVPSVRTRWRLLLALCALWLVGCDGAGGGGEPPARTPAEVIALHADSLMAIPGVVGVYEGVSSDGKPVLRVMLAARSAEAERRVPKRLDGYRVELEITGKIEPM